MRFIILAVIVVLVFVSFGATLIQNFGPSAGNATSTDSGPNGFSFFNVYTPTKSDEKKSETAAKTNVAPTPTPVPTPEVKKETIDPTRSVYKDKIRISSLSGTSEKAEGEYIFLSNSSISENIDITNFTIETSANMIFKIPKGYAFPGFSASPEDETIIPAGGTAKIYVGRQDRQMNFRENLCAGYFDQYSDFKGTLGHRCPQPDTSKNLGLNDACLKTLSSIPICRTMDASAQINYECNQFANEHYSYIGCVNDFKSRKDFYLKNWLIWMQRGSEFFRNFHEKVTLKDQSGKIVDEYSY